MLKIRMLDIWGEKVISTIWLFKETPGVTAAV
jgi:hypothetical protein